MQFDRPVSIAQARFQKRALIGKNPEKLIKNACITSKTLRPLAVRELAQFFTTTAMEVQ
jgi:hypothetical protein